MKSIDYGKVLVVDDDPGILGSIKTWLGNSGFTVVCAENGPLGLQAFRREAPDILLLDVMLPGMDGLELCRRIRSISAVPILILSAQGEFTDKILGLELGADDYLGKPFHPKELIARVRAQLRRKNMGDRGPLEGTKEVAYGPLRLQNEAHIATLAEEPIDLTRTEFGILFLLASNPGASYTRERILSSLWGEDFEGDERTVDSHVRNLRRKLKRLGCSNGLVESVWGVGYRLPKVG